MARAQAMQPAGVREWVSITISALLLLWPATLNGYPLVYSDTGNYIGQALKHYIGWNAPPFYSFFLLATDLRISLWLTIFAQGLIATHLLYLVLRQFGWCGPWPVLLTSLVLTCVSSLPWFVSFVTPYVFAAFVVLSLWLLAFGELGAWTRRYLWLLAVGSVSVHFSHVPLAVGLAVAGGMIATAYWGARAGLLAFSRIALAPAVASVMLMSVYFVAHGKASISPYGSVLVAARMLYDGTARDYLLAACPARQYRICPYIDRLPEDRNDFLFNTPLLSETLGGAKAWAPEAKEIMYATIAYEPGIAIKAALDNSLQVFGRLWLHGGLHPWRNAAGPGPMIAQYFPAMELAAYGASLQTRGRLQEKSAMAAPPQVAMAWAGMAALLALLYLERRRPTAWTLCMLTFAALVGNAVITGGLSGVEDHYEARVAWLMVFVPAVVLARRFVRGGRADASLTGAEERGPALVEAVVDANKKQMKTDELRA